MTRRRFFIHLGVQFVGLVLIAGVSALPTPTFLENNWDTVLFLTPIGIVRNLLMESPVLRSFYLDVSSGNTVLNAGQSFRLIVLWLLMTGHVFFLVREARRYGL